jgi:uncharacterized membrane protein
MQPRREGVLVRQSEYLIDRKNDEIEQLKAQLVNEQRKRFEEERDQMFTFVFIFSLGFFAGVGALWLGMM